MELGNDSKYQESHSKIKTVASAKPAVDGEFARLTAEFAADDLQKFESHKAQARQESTYSKESVEASQRAKIVKAFDVLVKVSMPSPNDQAAAMRHMRLLKSLDADPIIQRGC
jgi:hypothetical protein